ncbi:MAG: DNA (cytosine-5-)-methyltransferase [Mycoplasmoidaceae bacterium]
MKKIKLFEAFAGIGSQYKALKNISKDKQWNIEVVGIVEWYVDAIIAYLAIHHNLKTIKKETTNIKTLSFNSKDQISKKQFNNIQNTEKAFFINQSKKLCNNLFDITKVTYKEMPKGIDIFTYSFPCQDLSQQGKQKGITKNTRSGLLLQIDRILSEMKENYSINDLPKYLLLENVKNISSKKHLKAYESWLSKLGKLGYESKTYVLNSRNFGSPQNRTRIFCVSIRKDFKDKVSFDFPEFKNIDLKNKKIKSILEKNVDEKYYMDNLMKYSRTEEKKSINGLIKCTLKNYTNFNSEAYLYNINGKGPTLTASGANSRIKILVNNRIRRMTPLETYLYMGFKREDFKKISNKKLLIDVKLIYTAGNSISVEVLEGIFNSFKFLEM